MSITRLYSNRLFQIERNQYKAMQMPCGHLHTGLLSLILSLILLIGSADLLCAQEAPASPVNSTTKAVTFPLVREFPMPRNATLCGERVPLELRDVNERLDMELTIAAWGHAQVFLWYKRAAKFFPFIEKELARAGLPDDIKYLAVAESDLRPQVRSPANALGTWQFMSSTGKRFGLKKDSDFDQRRNITHSTKAAVKYLKYLYGLFGKWSLAMAAYNCGEGRVAKEIKEQGVRDYYRLNLPVETERYIYRIVAIKIILENPEKYGFSFDPDRAFKPEPTDRIQVELSEEVHFTKAAKAIGTTYKTLKEMNPEILGRYLPEGTYEMLVPAGSGKKLAAFLKKTVKASSSTAGTKNLRYWVVKRGQTLGYIAAKAGCSIREIKKLNRIKGDKIMIGQKLKLP